MAQNVLIYEYGGALSFTALLGGTLILTDLDGPYLTPVVTNGGGIGDGAGSGTGADFTGETVNGQDLVQTATADLTPGVSIRVPLVGNINVPLGSSVQYSALRTIDNKTSVIFPPDQWSSGGTMLVNEQGELQSMGILGVLQDLVNTTPLVSALGVTLDIDDIVLYSSNAVQNQVVPICFAEGTLIDTPSGKVTIETLMPGDEVRDYQGIAREIKWIGKRTINLNQFGMSRLRPIQFKKGSLGPNCPDQDLYVSPRHRMLISGSTFEILFGSHDILIPAEELINDHTICTDYTCTKVTYFHILCEDHAVLNANGAPAESLQYSDDIADDIDPEGRREIFEVFPELETKALKMKSTLRIMRSEEWQLIQDLEAIKGKKMVA